MKQWTAQELVEKLFRLGQLQQWSEEQVAEAVVALGACDELVKLAFCRATDEVAIFLLYKELQRLGKGASRC